MLKRHIFTTFCRPRIHADDAEEAKEMRTAELPFAELDEGFRQRSAYQEGSLTDPPDLSIYQD